MCVCVSDPATWVDVRCHVSAFVLVYNLAVTLALQVKKFKFHG